MWIDRRLYGPGIAVSLLINVFLIGIIAGHLYYAGGGAQVERRGVVPPSRVRALPADEKKKFVAAMAARKSAIQAARQAHLVARRALERDIAASVFDQAEVTARFADLRAASTALQKQAHGALVEALAALSPASRAALVAHPRGARRRTRRAMIRAARA